MKYVIEMTDYDAPKIVRGESLAAAYDALVALLVDDLVETGMDRECAVDEFADYDLESLIDFYAIECGACFEIYCEE